MHGRLGRKPGKFMLRQLILLEESGVGNVARVIAIGRLADNDTQFTVSDKKPTTLRDTRKLNDHEFVDNGVDGRDDDDEVNDGHDNLGYNQHSNENFHRA